MPVLGLVGIVDKGAYSADATYNKGNFVLFDGSTWLALKNNMNGVTPEEGENWKYLARGFASELLSLVSATDTYGLVGEQQGTVTAQALMDVLADKVANKLVAKSKMTNVQVNDENMVPTAALAYAMQQQIDQTNSDLLKIKTKRYNVSISTIQDRVSKMYAGSINFANDKPSGKILSTIAQPASYKDYTDGAGITTMIAGDLLICGTLYPDGDTWLEIDVIWLYI